MALEIQGAGDALLDDPLDLRVRGAGPDLTVVWRARLRDDDERVWRSTASRAADLPAAWEPAKKGHAPPVAALASLRPLAIDVRAELEDGRAVKRTITRRLVARDVRVRRWRDGVTGTLHRPAPGEEAGGRLVVDASAEGLTIALLAAPLLASRGVLVFVVAPGKGSSVEAAGPVLAAVPGAAAEPVVLEAAELPVPPGIAATVGGDRDGAWDALIARLGGRARRPGAAVEAEAEADGGGAAADA
jgi:hypothetical protein